jgi:hypothetical protein
MGDRKMVSLFIILGVIFFALVPFVVPFVVPEGISSEEMVAWKIYYSLRGVGLILIGIALKAITSR